MTKRAKLLAKLRSGRLLTFDELDALLLSHGFVVDVTGSHHIYRRENGQRVVLPRHGKEVKAVYQAQVREVLNHDPQ